MDMNKQKLEKIIYTVMKYYILFCVGGMSYVVIELLYRQRSTIEMLFLGSICFVAIGALNNIIPWSMKIWKQALIGGFLIVTPLEYLFGIIFNQDYHIWDYRNQSCQIDGQVCLLFTLIWCLISAGCIILDDYLRFFIFGEDKPKYYL